MDEATSNIDEYTDSIIQNVIKKEFKDTTIGKTIYFKLIKSNYCSSFEDCYAL